MSNEEISRREFVKQSAVGAAVIAGAGSSALAAASPNTPPDLSHQVVAALGDLFIPSSPGDPGYKDLETYGISDYVMKAFPQGGAVEEFNNGAKPVFQGKTFLELDQKQREQYLEAIIDGNKIADEQQRKNLQGFYRVARIRILTVYYKNYPEHEVKRNAKGEPILPPGDKHQITNPNTKQLVTGWDIAGFKGPLDWEQEEKQRAIMKKVLPHWYEEDLIKLTTSKG